jgi:hypothetical protein
MLSRLVRLYDQIDGRREQANNELKAAAQAANRNAK